MIDLICQNWILNCPSWNGKIGDVCSFYTVGSASLASNMQAPKPAKAVQKHNDATVKAFGSQEHARETLTRKFKSEKRAYIKA